MGNTVRLTERQRKPVIPPFEMLWMLLTLCGNVTRSCSLSLFLKIEFERTHCLGEFAEITPLPLK